VPAEVAWQTPPALARALGDQARVWGVPLAWGGADAGYGANPAFLQGCADRQVAYVVGVSSSFGMRLAEEVRAAALGRPSRPRGRGWPPKPRPAPRSQAQTVLGALPADRWQMITGRAPDAGVLCTQCVDRRVPWATVGHSFPRAILTCIPGQRAGCSASVQGQEAQARRSGITASCRRTRRCTASSSWGTAAGLSSSATRPPRARVVWTPTRGGGGMACIGILPSSCSRLAFWRASAGGPPPWRALPPSGEGPSFPAIHRQVLLGLFQEVVVWLIATNQIAHFRPMRI
jgi:hypothetical protein